jgi:deoxyribodipyrimidine photo-lyase
MEVGNGPSSSGCDAQPDSRIFNPITQSGKLILMASSSKQLAPVQRLACQALHAPWLSAPSGERLKGIQVGKDYPMPIVDHAQARESTLKRYAVVKNPDLAKAYSSLELALELSLVLALS